MPETSQTIEKVAERIVDGQAVDWQAADAACTSDEERAFVRNLRIVDEIATVSDAMAASPDPHTATTLLEPAAPASVDTKASSSTEPRPADLTPGTRWGPLEILEKIGAGGFGHVYKARDVQLQHVVALKILHLEERFREERALSDGRLLAKVHHRNVVTVHGAQRVDDSVGIWMEYIDGQTLEDQIKHLGQMGAGEASGIGIELCRALAAVHKAKLVHGDLKAQNVMKEKGGRIVLMDFGAAREVGPVSTADMRISGTPLYLPPEVFEGRPMTVAGDIYTLGVLLYHLVTGSFPVKAENLRELRRAHTRGEMTLLRDERPDLPDDFIRIVEKALAHDPAERFTTMGHMQQAFEKSEGKHPHGEPVPPPPVRPPANETAKPAAFRPLYVALAAAGALVAVVAATLWLKAGPTPVETQAGATMTPVQPTNTKGNSSTTNTQGAVEARILPAYSISAALFRSAGAGRERLIPGARVRVGDGLHMDVEASDALYFYVLNHDQAGKTFTLFPRPDCDLKNPLPAGRHRLPGVKDGIPQDWKVTSVGGREQILMLASRTPLAYVEDAIARLPKGEQFAELPTAVAIKLRGIGGVAPQPSGAASPDAARLFEDIKRLADSTEVASGTWMRQIDLENPPLN